MEVTQPSPTVASQPQHNARHRNPAGRTRSILPSGSGAGAQKFAAYGLPCAICHLYYPADLDACPTCQSEERVTPVARTAADRATQGNPEAPPAEKDLHQEHDILVRELKSDLATTQAATESPTYTCSLEHNHTADSQPAEVCQPCFDSLQRRLDVCEAALHIDLKEAAQIVYDAVWADPSDPNKTYRNAANALLMELRKRAGMNGVRGPFHPAPH